MPVFPSPKINEETPKKTRPKSLAISTPTKLLSLEEARSRALTSNLPGDRQKFIDVGGGEENLPIKYHTVIELPTRRRSVGKGKKSPSGWKSFFSRGWHTTSGRRKNRRDDRAERLKIGSPIFSDNSPLLTQDKAVTEADVSHTNTKKLRTVKSAETLFPHNSGVSHQLVAYAFSPVEEIVPSPKDDEIKDFDDYISPNVSPSKYSLYQKHIRSISHDSYFERNIEFTAEGESELEDKTEDGIQMTSVQKSSDSEVEHLLQASNDDNGSDSANDSPARRFKIAQKQKRLSFDTEASSPKLQKLSLKRLYHNLSSPPMEKRKEKRERSTETSTKSTLAQKELRFENNPDSAQDQSVPEGGPMLQDSLDSVPSTDKSSHLTKLPETANRRIHDTDTVTVEVHKLLNDVQFLDTSKNQDDSYEMLVSSTIDDSDNLVDFSMEATLSESVNLSQLCSFDSHEQAACLPDGSEKQSGLGFVPVENSLATPDSPTGDNVSEIPSSEDSDIIESTDIKLTSTDDNFVQEVQNKQYSGNGKIQSKQTDLTQLDTQNPMSLGDNNTDLIRNSENVPDDVPSSINFNSNSAQEHLPLNENIVDDIILSPPESFHDDGKKRNSKTDDLGVMIASEIKASSKSPGARTMERSKTEVHEICAKLVSGIAVSGSFGQELFRANSDFVDSHVFNKKRSCSDKLSPISPNEDSKRKFESEIGRLIVRDRQMKLEMEQMKAERQKSKASEMPTLPEVEKSKAKTEKKFADALDLRKSPVKTFEDRKKVDIDDFFKSQKENIEDKKCTENVSSQNYSRYLRMEHKPSVKELLSKFEGRTQFSDTIQKFNSDAIHNSPLKHSSNVFSNVQVINHNFSLTPSKSVSSNTEDRNQSSQDNQHPLSKEHIFQTECVIRFPHPKTSILSQIQNESQRNGLSNFDHKYDPSESNSWSSGQYDHHTKVNHSRTSFLSSDNLSTSPGRCRNDFSIPQYQGNSTSEHSRMSRSAECKRTPASFDKDRTLPGNDNVVQENTDHETNTFSGFKDTFTRANRLTAQMRNEFLQRGLPQDNGNYTYFYGQDDFSGNSGSYFSGSPPVSRRRQPPTRQRPKSVPPPICRLSLANSKQSPTVHQGSHTQFVPTLTEFSQNVPKTSGVKLTNGKESIDASQTYGPPKRVRDRAAIFERSLSFSGPADAKTLPSSGHSTQKAQQDSSAR